MSNTDRSQQIIMAVENAERVLPLFERVFPSDRRPRAALAYARQLAASGKIADSPWNDAVSDALDALYAVSEAAGMVSRSAPERRALKAAAYAAAAARDAATAVAYVDNFELWIADAATDALAAEAALSSFARRS